MPRKIRVEKKAPARTVSRAEIVLYIVMAIIAAVTFRLEPAAGRTATSRPPGTRTWEPALAGAFDPKGLLRAGALR